MIVLGYIRLFHQFQVELKAPSVCFTEIVSAWNEPLKPFSGFGIVETSENHA